MNLLARKMMMLSSRESTANLPTAIFGSASSLAQHLQAKPPVRVGLWPCKSNDRPEIGMGLMTVLGFLLERWQEIRVYRLFAQLEGEPEAYTWAIDKSQFDVDDWQVEDLDENVAIWATLEQSDNSWVFKFAIENDLSELKEPELLSYDADHLNALIGLLPTIASNIVELLPASRVNTFAPIYTITQVYVDEAKLTEILHRVFDWELKLLLFLWGQSWSDEEVLFAHDALFVASQAVDNDFAAWVVSNATARAMLPGFSLVGELLVGSVARVIEGFDDRFISSVVLARALHGLGNTQDAYELLESQVASFPQNSLAWLALAELYRSGGRGLEAIDTFQRAIEADSVGVALYLHYAALLLVLDFNGIELEEFILIDPDSTRSNRMNWEAIEAYQEVLMLDTDHIEALHLQLMQLVEVDVSDERVISGYARLVVLDETGDRIRSVVDSLYNADTLGPITSILNGAIAKTPDRADLYITLALAYVNDSRLEEARKALTRARTHSEDPLVQAEIDRLMLIVENPDFEVKLGELTAVADTNKQLSIDDVDFLEDALEKVPTLGEGYILLAKAYLAWNEPSTAIETLLDGHKYLKDDPDILELLAKLLWEAGERKLAFEYINKGLLANPSYVPILALGGRYLFDDGQIELAKAYLARAETISPRHPALRTVQTYIATTVKQE